MIRFTLSDLQDPQRLERVLRQFEQAIYAKPGPAPAPSIDLTQLAEQIRQELQATGSAPLNLQSLLPGAAQGVVNPSSPPSSVLNDLVLFADTTGLSIKDSGVVITNVLTFVGGFPGGTTNFLRSDGTFNNPIASIPTLASGVYTPIASASVNLDSVSFSQAQYLRVGSTVTVSGRFTLDATVDITPTSFQGTLPIASNLGAPEDLAGTAIIGTGGILNGAEIFGVAANDTFTVQFQSFGTASQTWSYTFTYRII